MGEPMIVSDPNVMMGKPAITETRGAGMFRSSFRTRGDSGPHLSRGGACLLPLPG